ncbi:MAG: peptidase MA family metallohydrolase [Candidatus Limnocylindria bacterium]
MRWLGAGGLAVACALVVAAPAAAFDRFGEATADSTYDRQIRFDVELTGGAPERLELLLSTPGSDSTFVIQVIPREADATYVWDTSANYVTPNTLVTYRWRATEGEEVVVSDPATIRYEDDRPGLDWQTAQLGETAVHWYGDAETQAMRFGELAALGVEQGEALLGTELAGPVDVFIYDSRDDFFGAIGPGAREWTGAVAFNEIRTIFMWLGGGPADYLEAAMVHEITHIVFFDATDNPFHDPGAWINEGIAGWSETRDAGGQADFVRSQANAGDLFAFEALTERFPIGDLGSSLSYAQGASMIDHIIDTYGEEAIARMAAAYRDGASDEEALEAATGIGADELYGDFYAQFGVDAPTPVEPEPIAPSNVDTPDPGEVDPGGVEGGPSVAPGDPAPGDPGAAGGAMEPWVLLLILGAAIAVVVVVAVTVARRAARTPSA